MFSYYMELAFRSLRRNPALTVLMVAAIGVGIGASMTALTILRAMAADPIPEKSSRLFLAQIDTFGPKTRGGGPHTDELLMPSLTYRDAIAFMRAHQEIPQAGMYSVRLSVNPAGAKAFAMRARAVSAGFFTLFQAPFQSGNAWSSSDEERHSRAVVLGAELAQRLFPHGGAVGSDLSLNDRDYRIVGVLAPWNPTPRFYDMSHGGYEEPEQLFIPLATAIDRQIAPDGGFYCDSTPPTTWSAQLNSECVWIALWVELPSAAAARDYHRFLYDYADEARRVGRFHWPPLVQLPDVTTWLVRQHAITDEARVSALVACGFLLVCLINVVALMVAKFSARTPELGVRRALGAAKTDIFLQCLVETAAVGTLGGIFGLTLTVLGLAADRAYVAGDLGRLAHLDQGAAAWTVLLAVATTVLSGLYPTWRASGVQPALQLKAR